MKSAILASTLVSLALCACSVGTSAATSNDEIAGGDETGGLLIEVTDAPIDPNLVEEAVVHVDQIRVHVESDAEDGFLTLYDGAPIAIDLFELRNGVTRPLVIADDLPVGTYRQIRLRIDSGYLRLTNGNEYATADGTLLHTSQSHAGLKVNIEPGIDVVSGLTANLLVDFDLSKSFKPVPGNDPLAAEHFKLHPVVRAANRTTSGEIRGFVTALDSANQTIYVAGASVFLMPDGEVELDASMAATTSDDDGSFAFIGIPAGLYDLAARKGELDDTIDDQNVVAGNTVEAVFLLE